MLGSFYVCTPSTIPLASNCVNFDQNKLPTSFNASFGPLQYSSSNSSQQWKVCAPILKISSVCVGVSHDVNGFQPFVSGGIGNNIFGYELKSSITDLYNKIATEQCITKVDGKNIVTNCGDTVTTATFNENPQFTDQSKTTAVFNMDEILNQIDQKVNTVQRKVEDLMVARNITPEQVGVKFSTNIDTSINPVNPIMSATAQLVSTIIQDIKIVNPNFTIFDVLNKFNENNVDKNLVFNVLNENKISDNGLVWRVDKPNRTFYPDCCQIGNGGMDIDYHLYNKIDYCRICRSKFRIEYFL